MNAAMQRLRDSATYTELESYTEEELCAEIHASGAACVRLAEVRAFLDHMQSRNVVMWDVSGARIYHI